MRHLIWIPLSVDRPGQPCPAEWVRARIDLCERFTLRSLWNQRFKDFEVCIICGERNRAVTDAHGWPEGVRLVYDKGESFIPRIDSPYIAVSRIDSDDMYRNDALEFIDAKAKEVADRKPKGFVLGKNLLWNRLYRFVGRHHRMCNPPPFVTRVYPRHIFGDWSLLSESLSTPHGNETRKAIQLERVTKFGLCCVVKHGTNWHQVKQGRDPRHFRLSEIETQERKGAILSRDPEEMKVLLKPYGIKPDMVDEEPGVQYVGGEFTHLVPA